MNYDKPWLSIEDQADLLIKEKGLKSDRDFLCMRLREVGYYRLSAYWFPYKTKDETGKGVFLPGTEFMDIWQTYVFDRELRLLMFGAVSRIEVFVRSQISYHASKAAGPFDYPQEDIARLMREYKASKKSEVFMKHFDSQYGDNHSLPPYWMMVESVSMGTLESLYSHVAPTVRSEIADLFSVKVPVFKNWLSVIRVARNACCHHARVWNRIWGVQPVIPKSWTDFEVRANRTFAVLTVLNYMLCKIDPSNTWKREVEGLLEKFKSIPKAKLGFPDDWLAIKPWKNESVGSN